MTTFEVISAIVSAIAIIISFVNVIFYRRLTKEYNGLVKEQNKIAMGQAETSIRDLIMQARRHIGDVSAIVAGMDSKNAKSKKIIQDLFESAQEDLRNAYEEACSRYLDGKVDKERFKKMYHTEIRQLVEDKEQNKFYDNISSRYECTVKVYTEWCKLEK